MSRCDICHKDMDSPYELGDKVVCVDCYSASIDSAYEMVKDMQNG